MSLAVLPISPLAALLYFALGLALGTGYFTLLRRTVRLHVEGAATGRLVAEYALRLVVAAAVFVLVARQGALPLLLAFAGFLVARLAVTRIGKGAD